jgi:hypothetical protein
MPLNVRLVAVRHISRSWDDVAALASDSEPAIRRAVRQLFEERMDEVPIEAFVHWIDDGPVSPWESAAAVILRRVQRGRPSAALQRDIGQHCRRRLAVVEAALRAASIDLEGDAYWQSEDPSIDEHAHLKSLISWLV